MTPAAPTALSAADGTALTDALMRLLRLKTTPIVMQMFASVAEMEAVPRIRRPSHVHTTDQIVGQAARLGFTVGITVDDLVGPQCSAVLGLSPRDAAFERGEDFAGVWFDTVEDASAHQKAMHTAPYGRWTAMAVSPLNSGRLTAPQIALVYANPAQMILLINGLQWAGYERFDWSVVGESSCADSWGRALATGRLACRSRVLPSGATAACPTTSC